MNTNREDTMDEFEKWLENNRNKNPEGTSGYSALDSILIKYRSLKSKEEPLAVLCWRKGWWITCIRKRPIGWCINLDSKENYVDFPEEMVNTIYAPTYPEAEAKAREYLNGLPDKETK